MKSSQPYAHRRRLFKNNNGIVKIKMARWLLFLIMWQSSDKEQVPMPVRHANEFQSLPGFILMWLCASGRRLDFEKKNEHRQNNYYFRAVFFLSFFLDECEYYLSDESMTMSRKGLLVAPYFLLQINSQSVDWAWWRWWCLLECVEVIHFGAITAGRHISNMLGDADDDDYDGNYNVMTW